VEVREIRLDQPDALFDQLRIGGKKVVKVGVVGKEVGGQNPIADVGTVAFVISPLCSVPLREFPTQPPREALPSPLQSLPPRFPTAQVRNLPADQQSPPPDHRPLRVSDPENPLVQACWFARLL